MTGKTAEEYNIFDGLARMFSNAPARNVIVNEAGWTLSYNPWCEDTNSDETAIIIPDKDRKHYLILYGDHRAELKFKTRTQAIDFFKKHPELHGATSDEWNYDE